MRARLGPVTVGDGEPVRIMGVINVSPESFYKGSVKTREDELIEEVLKQLREGADIIDIGAKSTAPYLRTEIPVGEEVRRAMWAIKTLRDAGIRAPISIDTTNALVAEKAIEAGANIVNDVSGLKGDERMALVVREYGVSAVLAAHVKEVRDGMEPVKTVINALNESLEIARSVGIDEELIVIDPAIGFIRPNSPPWYVWDSTIIARLEDLRQLGRPTLIGISRKSFIGAITGRKAPEERLAGSLAATAIAVLKGVHVVRTHDVRETLEAVKVASFIRNCPPS